MPCSHFHLLLPIFPAKPNTMFSPTHPHLLPITPDSSNAKSLTPLFEEALGSSTSLVPLPFLHSTPLQDPLDFHSLRIQLPSPCHALCPPGLLTPKFSPHFRPLAPPSPQRKEAGGRREEGRHSAR